MGIFALRETWITIYFFCDSWIYIFPSSGNWFSIFFVIRELCIYLRVICEPTTFAGIIVHFFLEILASLKLGNYTKLDVKPAHSTRLRLEDWELTTATLNQKGLESSLSRCFTHGISMHQNGGFCMFCETWIEFVFLCDTWFSLCIFTWKAIASCYQKKSLFT